MPPRSKKRGGSSGKKDTPRPKREKLMEEIQQEEEVLTEEGLELVEASKMTEEVALAVNNEIETAGEVEEVKYVENPRSNDDVEVEKELNETETEVTEEETKVIEGVEEVKNVENALSNDGAEVQMESNEVKTEVTEEMEVTGVEEVKNVENPSSNDDAEVEMESNDVTAEVTKETKVMEGVEDVKSVENVTSDDGADVEIEPDAEDDYEEVSGGESPKEGDQVDEEKGVTQDIVEKMADKDSHGCEDRDDDDKGNENSKGDESGTDDEEDEDSSLFLQTPFAADQKRRKEVEIFVGGMDKRTAEDDLIKVFGEFGEIQAVRIVRHPVTQKSKGFAFIRYATVEQARKVLTELKDGAEVRGRRVSISLSQDSDTLYMGNVCKTWTKEQVLETLKSLGIEQIEEIYLPDSPMKEGKNKGFALLEFGSHSDAMAAFQRLRKPDAFFGRDRSAKVAFAQSMHPSEEALSQVKTVYVEGLTGSWDEDKLKKLCEQYGEVEKVQLSRNIGTTKRKDFGFVSFISRESAIACVEGINKGQIGDGDVKVKADLARPPYKGRLGKRAARGGYKIQKDGDKRVEAGPSKLKGKTKSKGPHGKRKGLVKANNTKKSKAHNPQSSAAEQRGVGAPSMLINSNNQRKERPDRDGKRARNMDSSHSGQPSKKRRGNARGKPVGGFGNSRKGSHARHVRHNYSMAPGGYVAPYAHGHVAHASSYQGHTYGTVYGSARHYSDMEPHAGYVPPAASKPARDSRGYGRQRIGGYESQGSVNTSVSASPYPIHGHSNYPAYQSVSGNAGYVYPQSGPYPYQPAYY